MGLLVAYLATAIVFALLDALWLLLMYSRFYRPTLRDIMLPTFDGPAALVYYVVYISGIVVLAVLPAIPSGLFVEAGKNGAIFGFFAFATYDLTNRATLRNWTWGLAFVDIVWGTFLTATAAGGGCAAALHFYSN